MINNISYIELMVDSDTKLDMFYPLTKIREDLLLLYKTNGDLVCNVCSRHQLQCDLLQCSKCKAVQYCSKECQKIDYAAHKISCKLAAN